MLLLRFASGPGGHAACSEHRGTLDRPQFAVLTRFVVRRCVGLLLHPCFLCVSGCMVDGRSLSVDACMWLRVCPLRPRGMSFHWKRSMRAAVTSKLESVLFFFLIFIVFSLNRGPTTAHTRRLHTYTQRVCVLFHTRRLLDCCSASLPPPICLVSFLVVVVSLLELFCTDKHKHPASAKRNKTTK